MPATVARRAVQFHPREEYEARLSEAAEAHGMAERTFLARRGDVLVWHAGLAHGGRPISRERTRKSVVTHYCPRKVAPLNWEQRSAPLRRYQDVACYTTVYHGAEQHR